MICDFPIVNRFKDDFFKGIDDFKRNHPLKPKEDLGWCKAFNNTETCCTKDTIFLFHRIIQEQFKKR